MRNKIMILTLGMVLILGLLVVGSLGVVSGFLKAGQEGCATDRFTQDKLGSVCTPFAIGSRCLINENVVVNCKWWVDDSLKYCCEKDEICALISGDIISAKCFKKNLHCINGKNGKKYACYKETGYSCEENSLKREFELDNLCENPPKPTEPAEENPPAEKNQDQDYTKKSCTDKSDDSKTKNKAETVPEPDPRVKAFNDCADDFLEGVDKINKLIKEDKKVEKTKLQKLLREGERCLKICKNAGRCGDVRDTGSGGNGYSSTA
jgi:hypothetical protein